MLSIELKCFQSNLNTFEWTRTLSNQLERFRMNSNAFKWTQTLSIELECFQSNSNALDWTLSIYIGCLHNWQFLPLCSVSWHMSLNFQFELWGLSHKWFFNTLHLAFSRQRWRTTFVKIHVWILGLQDRQCLTCHLHQGHPGWNLKTATTKSIVKAY